MYKILIADDEAIITDSLKYIIEQNIEESVEIKIAKTGRSVIEIAETFRPDIAFMDIQMPGINGIEAMKEIRKNNTGTLFIIMTAYDKFDYAKEAVNIGVVEYLTKPVNQKVIIAVLRKAMGEVTSRRERRSQDLQIKEKLEIVVPMIEQGFVSSGLFRRGNTAEVHNYKNLLGIGEEHVFALIFEFGESLINNMNTNPIGASVRLQRSYERIRMTIKESYSCLVGPVLGNKINCLIPTVMDKGDYESRAFDVEKCRNLVHDIEKNEELSCRIGIGSIEEFENMNVSFQDALNALNNAKGKVVHCRDLPIFCAYEDDYPIELEKNLFEQLKAGHGTEVKYLSSEFYDWMKHQMPEFEESLRLKTLEFVLFAEEIAYKSGGMIYRFGDRKDYIHIITQRDVENELAIWFTDKMVRAADNIATKKKEYTRDIIHQSKEYIQEYTRDIIHQSKEYIQNHYKKDLSLENISREMDVSPYYFSKLFKEVTGVNFIEYVTEVRLEKAKEMLLEGNMTMKEICVACGYSDPNYFSRIFKKTVGKTPT